MSPAAASSHALRLAVACLLALASSAAAQTIALDEAADRPISAIRIEGLRSVDEQLVRNQIRSVVGAPMDAATVRMDVRLLTQLGRFASIDAVVELQADGSVALIYRLVEQPIIAEVQVVGNKLVSDQELLASARIVRGVPRDDFLIQNAVRSIEELYRKRGHYLASVLVDESELAQHGLLLFRVIEGPRVRIKAVEFEGNVAFTDKQLRSQIATQTAIFLLRKGELDEDRLIDDVASIDSFYKDRGYLDVRVDRRVELGPDNTEAKVTFLIVEGPQYTLRSVRARRFGNQPLRVLAEPQVAAMIDIRPGDAFTQDRLRKSIRAVQEAYAVMGHIRREFDHTDGWFIAVRTTDVRVPEVAAVDLLIEIDEGRPFNVGLIEVAGNFLTKEKIIRRQTRLEPGRPFDGLEIEKTYQRLNATRLFNDVRLTVQDPRPDEPDSRDVLIEIKERNTGSFNFGVAVGSDAGVFGELSLRQDNFDIADWPESLDELIRGRAFRGAGQRFAASIRPGTEVSQYSISITEPHIFESDMALRVSSFYRQRQFDQYDEDRFNASLTLARRLGEFWEIALSSRFERVELPALSPSAPSEFFDFADSSSITGVSLSLSRSTIGTITRPGRGSKFDLSVEQVGALGGDFTYTVLSGDYTIFLTLDEDFYGRKTTLKFNTRSAYIVGGEKAPPFEQFYMGGRNFRGFEFRTISPKGFRNDTGDPSDQPVGGEFLYFAGAELEFPVFEDVITFVLFCDSGTVVDKLELDDYRVSVGAGLRVYIPQLGPIPIAFDFGFPILKQDTDQTQVVSFGAQFPF